MWSGGVDHARARRRRERRAHGLDLAVAHDDGRVVERLRRLHRIEPRVHDCDGRPWTCAGNAAGRAAHTGQITVQDAAHHGCGSRLG